MGTSYDKILDERLETGDAFVTLKVQRIYKEHHGMKMKN